MSTKQKTNLAQEEQSKLVKMYESALTSLAQETGKLVKKLQETQQKERYKVINDITNAVVQFYVIDLKGIMDTNYQQWIESEISLHKIVEGSGAGENAVNTSKQLEGKISSAIINMFQQKPQQIPVDDANPNIEPDKLQKMEEQISNYVSKISELQRKFVGKIDKAADENQLFNCIRGHVNATYAGALSGFDARASKVDGITENLRNNMKKQAANLSALNQSISSNSERAGSNMDKFPTIEFF